MTPEEFESRLKELRYKFGEEYVREFPKIAGMVATRMFKENFQTQSFFGDAWKEVKRREDSRNFRTITRGKRKGTKVGNVWGRRKILTGGTGDLGRSIEWRISGSGEVTVWTSPARFGSREPYGRVHNEGLRAGRGSGFTMPRRQFIGDHPKLRQAIVKELERKLGEVNK